MAEAEFIRYLMGVNDRLRVNLKGLLWEVGLEHEVLSFDHRH